MWATLALREQMAKLLAADAATLAPAADALQVVLLKNNPPVGENLAFADLQLADFDGSAALEPGVGAQDEGLDPSNNDAIVTMLAPAGGWRWETTGDTNLPQTIYGFALLDHAGTLLLAAETLPTPITLTGVNQQIDIGSVTLRQLANSLV